MQCGNSNGSQLKPVASIYVGVLLCKPRAAQHHPNAFRDIAYIIQRIGGE